MRDSIVTFDSTVSPEILHINHIKTFLIVTIEDNVIGRAVRVDFDIAWLLPLKRITLPVP